MSRVLTTLSLDRLPWLLYYLLYMRLVVHGRQLAMMALVCSICFFSSSGDFAMSRNTNNSPFDKIALELGRVDMAWSRIEDLIDAFIAELLHFDERSEIVRCITANADIRNKVQMVKSMSFIRKDDSHWFDTLVKHLNTIDNDLRSRRNSFVHAHWYKPGRKIIRQNKRTKLKRPQSFKFELTTYEDIPVKVSDVKKLHSDMDKTWMNMLLCLWYVYRDLDPQAEPLPQISFARYLQRARQTMHQKRAPLTRRRPPQSSPG